MELLLVDDDQGLAFLLKTELEDQGHHVDTASNGWDGASLGLKNRYDGRQVCRKLRKHNISTPVLIMSALDSSDEKEACLTAGARDFLAKPFLFDDLYHKVLKIYREKDLSGMNEPEQ